MATDGNEERPAATERADERAELRAVVAKAKAGDASALPQLRAILDGNPALVERFGDIARHADAAWVALAGGSDWFMREALARGAEERRAELTRPGATAVERLLVARVVACWLQANYLGAHEANLLGAGDTFRQLQYLAKRVERAQRMHLAAVGALVAYQKVMPVGVATGAGHALVAGGHEEKIPVRPQTDPRPRARLVVEVDAEPHDPAPEERERVRVRADS